MGRPRKNQQTHVKPPTTPKVEPKVETIEPVTVKKSIKFTFDETTGWWWYASDAFFWIVYKKRDVYFVEGLSYTSKIPAKYKNPDFYYFHEASGKSLLKPGTPWNSIWKSSKENVQHHPIIAKSTLDLEAI